MITKLRAAAAEESGFTLVELLIVIAILGVLAGVVVFSVAGVQDDSQKAACRTEGSTVKAAEEAYYVKNKKYGSETALTTAPNKLLGSNPTLVAITLTPDATVASGYTLAWAGGCTAANTGQATP